MSLSCCTSILRVGGPSSSGSDAAISIIQSHLTKHFSSTSTPTPMPTPSLNKTSGDGGTELPLLSLSNKYFTAAIQLKSCYCLEDDKDIPNSNNHMNEKEDGIMLIFPSDNTSVDTLSSIHEEITSKIDIGDTLRLCISTTSPAATATARSTLSSKEIEALYSSRVLWCLDHGYEYIEVNVSEHGMTSGFDQREKDGFARVVEAIQGTVWSSAIMKNNKSQSRLSESTSEKKEVVVNHEKQMNIRQEKEGVASKQDDVHNILTTEATTTPTTSSPKSSHDEIYNAERDKTENEDDERKNEAVLGDIEQVMKEANRIRHESKHDNNISDEDRRQRAGEAATMLMGLLDQLGFDDDDEGQEDCSSSDDD